MGLFDSVAGTFFNTATAAYNTVVRPVQTAVQTAVQTVAQPIVQGSIPTGQTQQVAVQPKPPIVTSVANQQTYPTQQAVMQASGSQVVTTPQVTPTGQTVYVTSRASPVTPEPVIISRPVEIQAPSVIDVTRMITPGVGLAAAAQIISGDPKVIQNTALDVAGLRSMAIQNQASALQARNTELQNQATMLQQQNQIRQASLEQQVLGFEQRKQDIIQRKQRFESLGPATSIEEYNTRLNEYNLLNADISSLNADSQRINAEAVVSNRQLIKEQIEILNTRDQLEAEGVKLNVDAANVGTTGLAGLSAGFDLRVNKPISDVMLTAIGKPFGITKDDVALGLQLNRQIAEARVTYGGPSIENLGQAYGAGMLQDTLMKPGEAALWAGVGLATGGIARAVGPGVEGLALASRAPGASLGARALGAGVRIAPLAMGGLFAGSVGLEVASQKTPGAMVSRLGGMTATEILPMVGGGIVGYQAPEIISGAGKAMRVGFSGLESKVRAGEIGQIGREIKNIPFTSAEQYEIGLSPKGRGETLLTQKQLAKARSIASTGEERVIAFDITTGKEIKLTNVKSSSNRVQWEYPEGIDPTHEVITLHSHPKEITFSRGDMRKFGFDSRVTEVAKGVVTPSGRVHIIEKPLKGGYKSDVFVQKWMDEYKPNWLRDIIQPKGRRINTFARTAAEMEMPFRIIEPGQNVVYKATRIGKPSVSSAKLSRARSIAPEMEPRLFDVEQRVVGDWATGGFDPFTSRVGKTAKVITPGGTSQLSETQLLKIQEWVYRGTPTEYTPKQRGRFPGTREWVDVKGSWKFEPMPQERFFDIQIRTVKRGQPKGVGGITQTPKPVMEEIALGKGWKVTEKQAVDALAKWNQPELGPPYSTMSSKFNKPFKGVGRKMEVKTSPETKVRIQKSRDIAQIYQQGYRPVKDVPTGLEFEPLGTGSQGAILPTGKKFSQPAPSPGGSKTLAKTFKNAEDTLNPLTSKSGAKGGSPELKLITKSAETEVARQVYESPQSMVPVQDVAGMKGVYLGRSELPNAAGLVRGKRGMRVYDIEEPAISGPLALRTFGIPQLSGEREDTSISLGMFPMIASVGVNIADRNVGSIRIPSVDKISGVDTNLRNVQPAITPLIGIGQLPSSLVGTVLEPGLDITPLVSSRIDNLQLPAITQVPTQAIIQIPDLTQTQVNLQQQLLITNMEVPPYAPPEFIFEIPPIPPIIIPGFPMASGGGGGGGGGAPGRGGYLFEETLQGGGDSDPFGVGKMNFDVGAIAGFTGTGARTKRRRRK